MQVCSYVKLGFDAPVAQGIEHRFPKPGVGGSNPSRRTTRWSDEIPIGKGETAALSPSLQSLSPRPSMPLTVYLTVYGVISSEAAQERVEYEGQKHSKGEGSVYRRKDGRVVGEYEDALGKRRYISGKTKKDVKTRLRRKALVETEDAGIAYDAENLRVGEYLDRWLADSVKDTVRRRTHERYESLVRVHIKPALGSGRTKLKESHARPRPSVCTARRLEDGTRRLKRSLLHLHRVLSKALKQAVLDGLVPRNAAAPVKPPSPRREEIRPLSREQARTFLQTVSEAGDRFEALYVVAVTAGLRQGELLGLKWEDLDLDRGVLQVRRTLSETRDGRVFEAPKSGKGRSIRLTQRAVSALRSHRKAQLEERVARAGVWAENGLVFASEAGTPMLRRNMMRHYKIRLKRAGLGNSFRFHDLRHTCATLLLREGVHVKFVQELLGHSDVSLTLNIYSHVLPDMGDTAAGAMDAALGV